MSSSSEYLIAVVDDNLPVARAVSRALTSHGYRVQTFSSGREYLDQRPTIRPTCLLADIRMPGLDGLEMHRAAHSEGSEVPTVFMTGTGDVTTVVQAMKEGAADLLWKPFSTDALFRAIDAAVDRAGNESTERRSLAQLWRLVETLTPREAEVAALVASGRLNKQVAAATGITEKTVKVHRARAMRKLHARSLAEMVRIVDRVLAQAQRASVDLDGVDVPRPANADIMAHALSVTATKA